MPTAKTLFNGERLKAFSLRSETRKELPLSPNLFNIVLEVPTREIRQEKVKNLKIGKEDVKFSLFAVELSLYIEKPKHSTKKLIELINNLAMLQDTKSMHISIH